jgi:lipoprotein-anchoring transpeptidase ErfK/SrfK
MAMIRTMKTSVRKLTVSLFATILFLSLSGTAIAANGGKTKLAPAVVNEAEQLLANIGYWITKVDGTADASTRHAVVAFQKVEGMKRTGVVDDRLLNALRNAARPAARFSGGPHVEIDITRQVLFLVNEDDVVTGILPISTGSGEKYFSEGKWQRSYTPRGTFRVTRQIKGVRKAPLGTIYYPNYFNGGIAIHGSNSIPVTPASHGCARIPRFAERELSDLVYVGMPVYVYD